MRTLDPIELEVLLDFISPDGWVFDLGIDRFNTFTERVIGVRIKDVYPNLSKGKALRRFVSEPGNEEKGYKLITNLMKYYELKIRGTKHPDVRPEEQFEKCRNILKSYESAYNRSATNPDYGHIKEKFLSIYKDGAYWKQGDPAIGLAIALEPMTDLVRFCIANKIDGLFSNALFVRTLVEIQSLGGEGTKPQESQQAEAAWNTFISVLLPYITLFSKRKNVSLVEFKLFLDNHKQIYTNRNGFYRNINAGPIIGLLERCKSIAMAFHREHEAMLETMYAGVFADEWEQFDFLTASDKPAPPQIEAEVQMNVSITRDIKYRRAEPSERPQTIGDVPVDEFWSRFNKEKNKAKIGAPSSNDHAANAYTQAKIAEMFGPPCTAEIVANWEAKARGANRGSVPPAAQYNGRLESYREELRKFPIGENVVILAAIVEQYKATEGVKAATEKPDTLHFKSAEALAKASGQVAAVIRDQSQFKNGN